MSDYLSSIISGVVYEGEVKHQRFIPIQHAFRYRLFMLLLNLDKLDHVFNDFWLWSTKQPNLAYLKRSDHLGPENLNLKEAVSQFILNNTGYQIEGTVYLLTHLRYWGYCFNPVSFYYCFDKNHRYVEWIIAEINNTPWGERYCYLLKTHHCLFENKEKDVNYVNDSRKQKDNIYHFSFPKNFHISPLMPMNILHDWWINFPNDFFNDQLIIHMNNYAAEKKMFTAHMSLAPQPITHTNMAKILINYPFMTGKIITAIYWQALCLKLKGAIFYSHPNGLLK